MKVAVVGRGAVGRALARAMRKARMRVTTHRGRSQLRLPADTDLVIVAVRDDAIRPVAARLPALPRAAVLHCSGAYRAHELLEPIRKRVREIGRLHPLLAVGPRSTFRGAVCAVEGRSAAKLARLLGARPIRLRKNAAPLYHAAAVLAAGHVVTLLDVAINAAIRAGVPPAQARAALVFLAQSALGHVARAGPARALTGPIARGDATVVARHLAALAGLGADARQVYAVLAARGLRLGRATPADRRRIKFLLQSVRP